jgi:hypothetical protein
LFAQRRRIMFDAPCLWLSGMQYWKNCTKYFKKCIYCG